MKRIKQTARMSCGGILYTSPAQRGRPKKLKKDQSEEESMVTYDYTDSESDEENGKSESECTSVGKNQPDKDGNMELHLLKKDLTKEFRSDEKLCLWRRDGAVLLQKYMVVSDESRSNDIIFKASNVHSCWEEKRKNDFLQIRVQVIGDKKEGKVKVVDIAEFEKYANEDRPKIDITPRGAEGGENYEAGSEEEFDENEQDEE